MRGNVKVSSMKPHAQVDKFKDFQFFQRLEAKYNENDKAFHYLEDLILCDSEGNESSNAFDTVTEGLLWLKRALEMIERFFRNMLDDTTCSDNVKHLLKKAYEDALLPYHGFFAQKGFQVRAWLIYTVMLCGSDLDQVE